MSYKFRGVIIFEGENLGAKEVNERRPEGQKGVAHVACEYESDKTNMNFAI